MPKLPIVKDKELIAALLKLGFAEARHRGSSHAVFKHPDGRIAVVAIHPGKDTPKGTLRGILRDMGISVQELIDCL